MRLITNLDPSTYDEVERLVETSDYRDVNQFIRVAVQNQISLEGEGSVEKQISDQHTPWGRTIPDGIPVDEPFEMSREDLLFFQQYYRFFPLVVVLVELAEQTAQKGGPIRLSKFRSVMKESVEPVRNRIKSWEDEHDIKRKNRKSTGLAKIDVENPEYSMKRFLDHYVGRIRQRDRQPISFGNETAFISYRPIKEENECLVQLTPEGRNLVELGNPLLQSGPESPPLSPEEAEYIVDHLRENLDEEYLFIRETHEIISGIDDETYTSEIDQFRDFLVSSPGLGDAPSDDRVRSMTAGVLSRMVELGLLDRGRKRGIYTVNQHPDEM